MDFGKNCCYKGKFQSVKISGKPQDICEIYNNRETKILSV